MVRLGVLVAVLLLLLVPAGVHAVPPPHTESYIAHGANVAGFGVSGRIASHDLDGDGEPETPRIGAADFDAGATYDTVLVSASDDTFGTNVPMRVCLGPPGGIGIDCSDIDCSAVIITDSPRPSDKASAYVLVLSVTGGLDVCMATQGKATATFG